MAGAIADMATDQLVLTAESGTEPPPPSKIRVRRQDCDLTVHSDHAELAHRATRIVATGAVPADPDALLAALQLEIDRVSHEETLIGGMQVRGAGLVPGLVDGHLVADDARGES
jgi:hypothetical protein